MPWGSDLASFWLPETDRVQMPLHTLLQIFVTIIMMKRAVQIIVVTLLTSSLALASITVLGFGGGAMAKFDSAPALFGKKFLPGRKYKAKLVLPKRTPYLCTTKRSHLLDLSHELRKFDDDEPLALLVERGGCLFERKGQLGSLLPNVKYIIVYDDVKSTSLLPMAGSNVNVFVGMLFISHSSGMGEFVVLKKKL